MQLDADMLSHSICNRDLIVISKVTAAVRCILSWGNPFYLLFLKKFRAEHYDIIKPINSRSEVGSGFYVAILYSSNL